MDEERWFDQGGTVGKNCQLSVKNINYRGDVLKVYGIRLRHHTNVDSIALTINGMTQLPKREYWLEGRTLWCLHLHDGDRWSLFAKEENFHQRMRRVLSCNNNTS